MDTKEANNIIAEYMGVYNKCTHSSCQHYHDIPGHIKAQGYRGNTCPSFSDCVYKKEFGRYTESLDALVPVWEKVGFSVQVYSLGELYSVKTPFGIIKDHESETIQEAAAIATAKAIQEMGE